MSQFQNLGIAILKIFNTIWESINIKEFILHTFIYKASSSNNAGFSIFLKIMKYILLLIIFICTFY